MDLNNGFKPFPIPVVAALGPGSQEDEGLDYMPMPQGMSTFDAPVLPEPEELAQHQGCLQVLQQALAALQAPDAVDRSQTIDLGGLNAADRTLLNQVLGEGEVAAQVLGETSVQVQESVFAGLWRVIHLQGGQPIKDELEVGAVPQVLIDIAEADTARNSVNFAAAPPAGVMNSPALLAEIDEQRTTWRRGDAPHVINLSLLPLSAADSAHLDQQLGAGRVIFLSRGYGNCRIVNTRVQRTWRVTYFNSTDIVILDTLEVCRVPEVACAAAEDLADSAERLNEVLDWVSAS
ncbi:MAG: hydrogenase expression/formation protein [Rubrivivax sp.]|nr:hydrogenase expression/formation protein [Rubrivivax sp.]